MNPTNLIKMPTTSPTDAADIAYGLSMQAACESIYADGRQMQHAGWWINHCNALRRSIDAAQAAFVGPVRLNRHGQPYNGHPAFYSQQG